MSEKVEKTFYSICAGLICYPGDTKTVLLNGQMTVVDPAPIRFTPLGSGSPSGDRFGYYTTSDPEHIAYLEKRMLECKDVIPVEEFNKRLTPAEDRNTQLEKKLRELTQSNALLQKLVDEKKLNQKLTA